MPRGVIITSYLEYPLDLQALLQPDDYIVCLDGGYEIAQRLAVHPDLLLGDFDSISSQKLVDEAWEQGVAIQRYPPEKDYTDLELAFRILDPETTPDLLVIGGLGGRLDQTVINIQMLQRYTGAFRRIELMDGRSRCFVIHGDAPEPQADAGPGADPSGNAGATGNTGTAPEPQAGGCPGVDPPGAAGGIPEPLPVHTIARPRAEGFYLSLLPLTEECSGVSLDGVKYPLQDARLRRGASLSISNEFRAEKASLRLRSGSLLVVITRGNDQDSMEPLKTYK